MTPEDKAFGEGQRACWNNMTRLDNPYSVQKFKRLWWAGWDSAQRAKIAQNTKSIGKY